MISPDGRFKVVLHSKGSLLHEYAHKGDVFVCCVRGDAFEMRLTNSSPNRVMAMVKVDGLSIIDGKETIGRGPGYILDPHKEAHIMWWRFDSGYCPPLHFGMRPAGFENLMDEPGNPGVIEVQFLAEQANPVYSRDFLYQSGYSLQRKVNVGWAGKINEKVIREQFAADRIPLAAFVIQYDSADVLQKMGISV